MVQLDIDEIKRIEDELLHKLQARALIVGIPALVGLFFALAQVVKGKDGVSPSTSEILVELKRDNSFMESLKGKPGKDGKSGSDITIPRGAVLAFSRNDCPTGWEDYQEAKGRYIVGVNEIESLGTMVGVKLSDKENRAVGKHTHSYDKESIGGEGSENTLQWGPSAKRNRTTETVVDSGEIDGTNAPYIQLLYCKKL